MLDALPLSHLHVFPYSDRPGTVASRLDAKVEGGVIRERARLIRDIGARLSARFRASQVGRQHRALTVDDGSRAVTGNYLKVRLDAPRERNAWVDVRIETSDPLTALLGARAAVRPRLAHEQGHLLSRRFACATFDNQLTTGRPDVAAAALAHRHRQE